MQSTSVLTNLKTTALHDRNAEIYPAHPAPRTPYSFTHTPSHTTHSPVLSRGPSGDQVVRIHHQSPEERAEEEAYARKLQQVGSSGSRTTTTDHFEIGADGDDDDDVRLEEDLEDELQNAEVRDWARRVSGDELKTIDIIGKGKDSDGSL